MQDTVDSIISSSKSEKSKIEDLKKLNNKLSEFIETASRKDSVAEEEIKKSKEDFYTKYSYLKPECEKSVIEHICDGVQSAADWCKEHWKLIVTMKTSLCKKENADYVSQTTIVCEFADSERVLFRQFVADNDSGHGLFKDTRTEKMLVETLHCDEIVADQINEEMHKYIMGQAFLVNEGYTEFDQARLAMETERVFEFVKKIFVK